MRMRSTSTTLFAIAALALTLSCDDGTPEPAETPDPPPEPGEVTRQMVLANLSTSVYVPAAEDFAERSAALSTAVAAWAAADGVAGAELDAARTAWRAAMVSWQYNEVLQAGPAGAGASFIGGQGLRDRIYSWPTSRPCGIDQNIVAARYGEDGFANTQLVNVLGLDAVEYLLFQGGTDNDCPSQVEINSAGTWDALDEPELDRRRAAYAAVLAADIAAQGEALRAAWDADDGGFVTILGSASDPYADARQALEQVFHGMFYLDKQVKDLKLAVPTALSVDCPSATGCPGELESPWAGHARQNLAVNVRAVRDLFRGGAEDGHGFDDLLVAAGAAELAEQMGTGLDTAVAAFEGDTPDLATLIADDLDAAQALHADVKAVTDLLKSQFVVVLDLNVPASGAADND